MWHVADNNNCMCHICAKGLMGIHIAHYFFLLKRMNVCLCDMIKRNELDVGKNDFELHAKRDDKFLYFTLFLNFK